MAVVTLGMMLLYSWKLALITLLVVALYLGLADIVLTPPEESVSLPDL